VSEAYATNSTSIHRRTGVDKGWIAWLNFIMHSELRIAANSTQNMAKALDFGQDLHQSFIWFWGRSNERDFELGSGEKLEGGYREMRRKKGSAPFLQKCPLSPFLFYSFLKLAQ